MRTGIQPRRDPAEAGEGIRGGRDAAREFHLRLPLAHLRGPGPNTVFRFELSALENPHNHEETNNFTGILDFRISNFQKT